MGKPLDFYLRGKVLGDVSLLTADRDLIFPNTDVDLSQLGIPVSEGFESATFPPASPPGAWSTPSKRYPSDLAYVRDTATPISGTASANRPAAQTHSQNSSLGLDFFLWGAGWIQFDYNVTSEATNDPLIVYIDGVEVTRFSGVSQTGTYRSARLAPGAHTIDWRFTKNASVTQTGECAKVDSVKVFAEGLVAEPWILVTAFTNSWVNYDVVNSYQASYRRSGNQMVSLRGTIKSGTIGQPAFQLPLGYRPAKNISFPADSNGAYGRLVIFSDGTVTPFSGSNAIWYLDGTNFYVD